ncbi:MAG: hypothetical protein AB7O97_14710 [Planctomycetota bacterium]
MRAREAPTPNLLLRSARVLLVALAMSPAVLAQQTWIVDKLNRPGTHFRDLPAAVAAAAPRDVLMLRATSDPNQFYSTPGVIDGKPLTVSGEGPGTFLRGVVEVRNLPASESFVFRDLHFDGPNGHPHNLVLSANAGTVVLSGLQIDGFQNFTLTTSATIWTDCALVIVDRCNVDVSDGPFAAVRSRVVVLGSTFRHSSPLASLASWFLPGTLHLTDSELWITASTIRGPSAITSTPPRAFFASSPLYVCRSTVHLGPATTLEGGVDGTGLRLTAFYNSCINSQPWPPVYVDPSVQAIGGLGPRMTYVHGSLAGLSYSVTPTTLQVDHLYGPAGASLLVLGPLASTPWSGGGIGPVFVDVANAWSDLRLALLPGPSTRTFAIPPGLPPGLLLGAQALTLIPPGTLLTSNVAAIALP